MSPVWPRRQLHDVHALPAMHVVKLFSQAQGSPKVELNETYLTQKHIQKHVQCV